MSKNENRSEDRRAWQRRPPLRRDYEWVVTRPLRLHAHETLMPGQPLDGKVSLWRLRGLYRNRVIAPKDSDYARGLLDLWVRRGGQLFREDSKPKDKAKKPDAVDEKRSLLDRFLKRDKE